MGKSPRRPRPQAAPLLGCLAQSRRQTLNRSSAPGRSPSVCRHFLNKSHSLAISRASLFLLFCKGNMAPCAPCKGHVLRRGAVCVHTYTRDPRTRSPAQCPLSAATCWGRSDALAQTPDAASEVRAFPEVCLLPNLPSHLQKHLLPEAAGFLSRAAGGRLSRVVLEAARSVPQGAP